MKVRHAVTFNRSRTPMDCVLADELLREWGKARGLGLPLFSRRSGWLQVEERDFEAYAFYAMSFDGDYDPWHDETGNRVYGSRLQGVGRPGLAALVGYEEFYRPVDSVS